MQTALDILEEKSPRMISVDRDATLFDAIERMAAHNIGAMLVKDGDKIVGIWSERDHLEKSLEPGYDPKTCRIGDYMQTELKSAPAETPILKLQELFLGLYIRHILIKTEEKYVGLLSVGDVIRASLLVKDQEIRQLHQIASWEYYENWGWHRKHRKK
ncbi:MAG: CBS domain-containing protein [Thermodesulfobacteriota bacterium]